MSSGQRALFGLTADSGLPSAVRAFRLVLVLSQQLRNRMDARLREDGLTTQQAGLLTAVSGLDSPSITDAAAAMGTTRQNLTQIVAALERKGLLRLDPDPLDARRRILVTTAASNEYWERRDDDDFQAVSQWFAALSNDELETFCILADRLSALE